VIEILDLSLNMFGMLFGANLSIALFYHYFAVETDEQRGQVVGTTLGASTALGLLGAAVGISTAGHISQFVLQTPNHSTHFTIMFLSFAATLPLETCFYWLKAINQSGLFVASSIARLVLQIPLTFLLLVSLQMSITGVLLSNLIATAVLAVGLCIFCISKIQFSLDRKLAIRLFRYSIPVTLTGAANFTI